MMLRGLIRLFLVLGGLFAAVAGLGLLFKKNAPEYVDIDSDDKDDDSSAE